MAEEKMNETERRNRRASLHKYHTYYGETMSVTTLGPYVGALHVGTRTVRFVIYNAQNINELESHSIDIEQFSPQEGWVEQNPREILSAVKNCIKTVLKNMEESDMDITKIVAMGIANQRETTLAWDSASGETLYNAILWSDIRTDKMVDQIISRFPDNNKNHLKSLCGLPVSSYFSALKIQWLMENVPGVRKAMRENRCMFGTMDTWLAWTLTGGRNGGIYVTDVTNASRTMLMNIETMCWDPTLCRYFRIPMGILPQIKSSSEIYGIIKIGPLKGVPISGILGNQQAALLGQNCLREGQAKNTYRSGCFLLCNTGPQRVFSQHGLVTTVAYQLGPNNPVIYALEGSVAVAGAAVKWLRDNMKMIKSVDEAEKLAQNVLNTGGVYFVPAFSGLYAPYWRKDARGIICGLTAFSTKDHIVRAALESVCFQTRDILEAMYKDSGMPLTQLYTDGNMTANSLLMQLQADIAGVPVVRSTIRDITALGVAKAAGAAPGIGVWEIEGIGLETIESDCFLPTTTPEERNGRYKKWKMAVQRSLGWSSVKMSTQMTGNNKFATRSKTEHVDAIKDLLLDTSDNLRAS